MSSSRASIGCPRRRARASVASGASGASIASVQVEDHANDAIHDNHDSHDSHDHCQDDSEYFPHSPSQYTSGQRLALARESLYEVCAFASHGGTGTGTTTGSSYGSYGSYSYPAAAASLGVWESPALSHVYGLWFAATQVDVHMGGHGQHKKSIYHSIQPLQQAREAIQKLHSQLPVFYPSRAHYQSESEGSATWWKSHTLGCFILYIIVEHSLDAASLKKKELLSELQLRLNFILSTNGTGNNDDTHNTSRDPSLIQGWAGTLQAILFLRQAINAPKLFQSKVVQLALCILQSTHTQIIDDNENQIQNQNQNDKKNNPNILFWPQVAVTSPTQRRKRQTHSAYPTQIQNAWPVQLGAKRGVLGILYTLLGLSPDDWQSILLKQKLQLQLQQNLPSTDPRIQIRATCDYLAKRLQPHDRAQDPCLTSHSWKEGRLGYAWFLFVAAQYFQDLSYLQTAVDLTEELWNEYEQLQMKKSSSLRNNATTPSAHELGLEEGWTPLAYLCLLLEQASLPPLHKLWERRAEFILQTSLQSWKQVIKTTNTNTKTKTNTTTISQKSYSLATGLGGLVSILWIQCSLSASFHHSHNHNNQNNNAEGRRGTPRTTRLPKPLPSHGLWGFPLLAHPLQMPSMSTCTTCTSTKITTTESNEASYNHQGHWLILPPNNEEELQEQLLAQQDVPNEILRDKEQDDDDEEEEHIGRLATFITTPERKEQKETNVAPELLPEKQESERASESVFEPYRPRILTTKSRYSSQERQDMAFWSLGTDTQIGSQDSYKPALKETKLSQDGDTVEEESATKGQNADKDLDSALTDILGSREEMTSKSGNDQPAATTTETTISLKVDEELASTLGSKNSKESISAEETESKSPVAEPPMTQSAKHPSLDDANKVTTSDASSSKRVPLSQRKARPTPLVISTPAQAPPQRVPACAAPNAFGGKVRLTRAARLQMEKRQQEQQHQQGKSKSKISPSSSGSSIGPSPRSAQIGTTRQSPAMQKMPHIQITRPASTVQQQSQRLAAPRRTRPSSHSTSASATSSTKEFVTLAEQRRKQARAKAEDIQRQRKADLEKRRAKLKQEEQVRMQQAKEAKQRLQEANRTKVQRETLDRAQNTRKQREVALAQKRATLKAEEESRIAQAKETKRQAAKANREKVQELARLREERLARQKAKQHEENERARKKAEGERERMERAKKIRSQLDAANQAEAKSMTRLEKAHHESKMKTRVEASRHALKDRKAKVQKEQQKLHQEEEQRVQAVQASLLAKRLEKLQQEERSSEDHDIQSPPRIASLAMDFDRAAGPSPKQTHDPVVPVKTEVLPTAAKGLPKEGIADRSTAIENPKTKETTVLTSPKKSKSSKNSSEEVPNGNDVSNEKLEQGELCPSSRIQEPPAQASEPPEKAFFWNAVSVWGKSSMFSMPSNQSKDDTNQTEDDPQSDATDQVEEIQPSVVKDQTKYGQQGDSVEQVGDDATDQVEDSQESVGMDKVGDGSQNDATDRVEDSQQSFVMDQTKNGHQTNSTVAPQNDAKGQVKEGHQIDAMDQAKASQQSDVAHSPESEVVDQVEENKQNHAMDRGKVGQQSDAEDQIEDSQPSVVMDQMNDGQQRRYATDGPRSDVTNQLMDGLIQAGLHKSKNIYGYVTNPGVLKRSEHSATGNIGSFLQNEKLISVDQDESSGVSSINNAAEATNDVAGTLIIGKSKMPGISNKQLMPIELEVPEGTDKPSTKQTDITLGTPTAAVQGESMHCHDGDNDDVTTLGLSQQGNSAEQIFVQEPPVDSNSEVEILVEAMLSYESEYVDAGDEKSPDEGTKESENGKVQPGERTVAATELEFDDSAYDDINALFADAENELESQLASMFSTPEKPGESQEDISPIVSSSAEKKEALPNPPESLKLFGTDSTVDDISADPAPARSLHELTAKTLDEEIASMGTRKAASSVDTESRTEKQLQMELAGSLRAGTEPARKIDSLHHDVDLISLDSDNAEDGHTHPHFPAFNESEKKSTRSKETTTRLTDDGVPSSMEKHQKTRKPLNDENPIELVIEGKTPPESEEETHANNPLSTKAQEGLTGNNRDYFHPDHSHVSALDSADCKDPVESLAETPAEDVKPRAIASEINAPDHVPSNRELLSITTDESNGDDLGSSVKVILSPTEPSHGETEDVDRTNPEFSGSNARYFESESVMNKNGYPMVENAGTSTKGEAQGDENGANVLADTKGLAHESKNYVPTENKGCADGSHIVNASIHTTTHETKEMEDLLGRFIGLANRIENDASTQGKVSGDGSHAFGASIRSTNVETDEEEARIVHVAEPEDVFFCDTESGDSDIGATTLGCETNTPHPSAQGNDVPVAVTAGSDLSEFVISREESPEASSHADKISTQSDAFKDLLQFGEDDRGTTGAGALAFGGVTGTEILQSSPTADSTCQSSSELLNVIHADTSEIYEKAVSPSKHDICTENGMARVASGEGESHMIPTHDASPDLKHVHYGSVESSEKETAAIAVTMDEVSIEKTHVSVEPIPATRSPGSVATSARRPGPATGAPPPGTRNESLSETGKQQLLMTSQRETKLNNKLPGLGDKSDISSFESFTIDDPPPEGFESMDLLFSEAENQLEAQLAAILRSPSMTEPDEKRASSPQARPSQDLDSEISMIIGTRSNEIRRRRNVKKG